MTNHTGLLPDLSVFLAVTADLYAGEPTGNEALKLYERLDAFVADVPADLSEIVKFHPEMDEPIVSAAKLLHQATQEKK